MNKSNGFTLIEILVVMVILGIMATLIVPKIMSRPEEARIIKAKQDIRALESALDIYRLDNGFYPTTDQGLNALITKPESEPVPANWKAEGYLQRLPKDPWAMPISTSIMMASCIFSAMVPKERILKGKAASAMTTWTIMATPPPNNRGLH